MAVSYYDGKQTAVIANNYHDPKNSWEDYDYVNSLGNQSPPASSISEPDYLLGVKAMQLGIKIRQENIKNYRIYGDCIDFYPIIPLSFNPGNWIRASLKQSGEKE